MPHPPSDAHLAFPLSVNTEKCDFLLPFFSPLFTLPAAKTKRGKNKKNEKQKDPNGAYRLKERRVGGLKSFGCTNHKQTNQKGKRLKKEKNRPIGIAELAQTVLEFSSNVHH